MNCRLIWLLFLPALVCAGAPDLREIDLQKAYGVTLRWDNLEREPDRVSGVKPARRLADELHAVRLSPGQWIQVQLAANALLRVHPVDPDTGLAALRFEVSSGSGLYVEQQARPLSGSDLLLDAHSTAPCLVRISLDANADSQLEFALFSSRLVEIPALTAYSYREDIGAMTERVRYSGDPGAQLFRRVSGGETIELAVAGPARYRLQQRLLLTGNDRGPHNYQLRYRLDDGSLRTVDASASAARRRQLLLNGEPVSAGNLRNDYVDIPEGQHRLRLQFSEALLLRVLKSTADDYLLPELNAPLYHDQPPATADPWSLSPRQLQAALQPGASAQTVQQSIMRTIVDNRRRGGGLVGPMTLMEIARSQPDAPALLSEAQVLLKRHSYYAELLPGTGENRQSRFAVRRLRQAQDRGDHYRLADSERRTLADNIETAWFTRMDGGDERDFELPARPADSLLRVLVLEREAPAQLQLFMDERPPLQLRLDRRSVAEPARYALNAAGALAAQAIDSDSDGAWQLPVQQTRAAALIELALPRQVKHIRLQRSDGGQQPLSVAMQYRRARPYRLSDASYTQMLEVLRGESALQPLWRACLTDIDTALDPETRIPQQLPLGLSLSENGRGAARAVVNQWTPLLRWLRARQESYRAGIDSDRRRVQRDIPATELDAILAAAQRAEREGHWLPALELWQRLSESTQLQQRRAALAGTVRALQKLGEYPLAERLLRGNYLDDTPAALQRQSFEAARSLYRQQNNIVALQGLLATELSRAPDAGLLSELSLLLADAGRSRDALTVGLLLPPGQRAHHRLLAIALKQRAWRSFEQLLSDVDDDSERSLWLAYRAWELDERDNAERYWRAAGEVGETLQQTSRQGQQILAALLHGNEPQRGLAEQRLAGWLRQLPGPRIWQPVSALASGQAGMAWLYSAGLDLGFNTLRTRPGRPLQLRIAGPARLRFDILPLHEDAQDRPLDGWIRIHDEEQEWISPFTRNRVSTTLSWPGSRQRPGRMERRELQLPAGTHQLEIEGIEHDLLVRIYVEAPQLDLGLSRPAARQPTAAQDWRRLARGILCSREKNDSFVDCRLGRRTLPLTDTPRQRDAEAEELPAIPPDAEAGGWHRTRPAPLKPFVPVRQAAADPSGPPTPYRAVVWLLWQLEKTGRDADAVSARLAAQAHRAGQQQAGWLRPLLKRATAGASWQSIDYVPESAGVRYVERPANAPQSPALRARAALLGDDCSGSRLLTGHDELVYSLYNLKPATLRLELVYCPLPFTNPVPVEVQLRTSQQALKTLSLTGSSGVRALQVHTGRGEQLVRLGMPDPAVNQFLGVRIHDPSLAWPDSAERVYHLATPEEPLRFDIEGPAWLRVDELRDGSSFSRYLAIDDGWQAVQLTPGEGREEALFRLYRRVAGPPPPPSRQPPIAGTATPLAGPVETPRFPARSRTPAHDDYPLGGQQDGTASAGLRLVSRTRVDDEEERRRSRFRENFAEARGEYRYFDAANRRYWRSEVLGRLREEGDPVLGFGQHLYNWPLERWPTLQTSAHLTGFVQRPGDELPGRNGRTEWTINARLRALQHIPVSPRSYHEPALSLFGRAMSMSHNNRYQGKSLDRDVFSRYKARHKRGLRLSESLVHKPWRDTEWYGQLAVTSNEDFNISSPDNLETRIGWRQLMGAFDVDTAYRLRHYLSDDDRNSNSTRNDLRLNVRWTHWNVLQHRSELRLFLNHDIDNSETSVFVGLFLHGGNGRGLRDFRNSEVRFSDIRQRNAPHSANRVSAP